MRVAVAFVRSSSRDTHKSSLERVENRASNKRWKCAGAITTCGMCLGKDREWAETESSVTRSSCDVSRGARGSSTASQSHSRDTILLLLLISKCWREKNKLVFFQIVALTFVLMIWHDKVDTYLQTSPNRNAKYSVQHILLAKSEMINLSLIT